MSRRWSRKFNSPFEESPSGVFLASIRAKHPKRSSDCGVLLAEILGGDDEKSRISAAIAYSLLEYRRGFGALSRLARELEEGLAPGLEDWGAPQMTLFHELLIAFGYMDTPEAHAFLVRVLKEWSDGWIQSGAIDGMAFEKRQFEPGLVLPFVSMEAHPHMIRCALYALMYQRYFYRRQGELEAKVLPLLKHEDAIVRDFVIMTMTSLEYSPEYRSVYEGLLEDESDMVRWSAEGAILVIEQMLLD